MLGSEKKSLVVWKTAQGEIRKNEICLHCICFNEQFSSLALLVVVLETLG